MKKIICTFISIAVLSILSIVSASAQSYGTRVEASIPFDFVVGKQEFKAGNYELSILRNNTGVYTASLKDENGNFLYRAFALRNGGTSPKDSRMVFAVVNGEHYLETIKTPEIGYAFISSHRNKKTVAQAERISIQTTASSHF